jgi:hypothetical protein
LEQRRGQTFRRRGTSRHRTILSRPIKAKIPARDEETVMRTSCPDLSSPKLRKSRSSRCEHWPYSFSTLSYPSSLNCHPRRTLRSSVREGDPGLDASELLANLGPLPSHRFRGARRG